MSFRFHPYRRWRWRESGLWLVPSVWCRAWAACIRRLPVCQPGLVTTLLALPLPSDSQIPTRLHPSPYVLRVSISKDHALWTRSPRRAKRRFRLRPSAPAARNLRDRRPRMPPNPSRGNRRTMARASKRPILPLRRRTPGSERCPSPRTLRLQAKEIRLTPQVRVEILKY